MLDFIKLVLGLTFSKVNKGWEGLIATLAPEAKVDIMKLVLRVNILER